MAQWRIIPADEAREIAKKARTARREPLIDDPEKVDDIMGIIEPSDIELARVSGFCLDDIASIRRVDQARHELVERVFKLVPLLDAYVAWELDTDDGYKRAFNAQLETLKIERVLKRIIKELAVDDAYLALDDDETGHGAGSK